MTTQKLRGSEKLLSAWKNRTLSEESVREIAKALDESPAQVLAAKVIGGSDATGVQLSLSYSGDDVPRCGNDILFWFKWHHIHGGEMRPPRIIIDGTPFPDLVRMELDFGVTRVGLREDLNLPGQLNRELGLGH
ncbi:hypothetical protein [Undibacterium parvum]|uniref:Uncharacterized protein n=2 Tax=Undibacterium TaxID=401469 RepID=A0A6M4A4J1_9BURK|nr:hypothetical protein [Undibacterium parvum]AZP11901.1 hypothetical protein EJN92_07730 [Undibacterium parvum]QJQ06282.1 hypothetical protein EJG51_010940 [Undibacterium piscinae]